jgi:hypothetical protein
MDWRVMAPGRSCRRLPGRRGTPPGSRHGSARQGARCRRRVRRTPREAGGCPRARGHVARAPPGHPRVQRRGHRDAEGLRAEVQTGRVGRDVARGLAAAPGGQAVHQPAPEAPVAGCSGSSLANRLSHQGRRRAGAGPRWPPGRSRSRAWSGLRCWSPRIWKETRTPAAPPVSRGSSDRPRP